MRRTSGSARVSIRALNPESPNIYTTRNTSLRSRKNEKRSTMKNIPKIDMRNIEIHKKIFRKKYIFA